MRKSELRTVIRKELLSQVRSSAAKSSSIMNSLISQAYFKKSRDLLIYVSKKEEVDTHKIIQNAISAGKNVYVPVITEDGMKASKINSLDELRPGKFGIPEPVVMAYGNAFDLIVLPGLAFDTRCSRLGRGGGTFDKFLAHAKGLKVGLAFDFQIVEELETEAHDIPVDVVITDKRIIGNVYKSAASK